MLFYTGNLIESAKRRKTKSHCVSRAPQYAHYPFSHTKASG